MYVYFNTDVLTNDTIKWNESGGGFSFQFDNLENKQKVTLGQYKPELKHLVVYPGLNIKGTCENKKCQGYQKGVWVKRGYGQLSLGQIRAKNKCPCCE